MLIVALATIATVPFLGWVISDIHAKPRIPCEAALIRGLAIQNCVGIPGCSLTPDDVEHFVRDHIKAMDECKIDIGPLYNPGEPGKPGPGVPQTQHNPGATT
jgi:hypothetical protein